MFQIAFAPEIRRRYPDAVPDDAFFLSAAQWIQPEEGRPSVRLNEEVRGTGLVRVNRSIEKEELVFASDIQRFEGFELEEADLDAGHFTLFWIGNHWNCMFDFRAGRAKSAAMLKAATEFLEAARIASAHGYTRPSVDNLFSACELVSNAHLILIRNPASRAKTHGSVHSAINSWRSLGNINDKFVRVFNHAANIRSPARYDAGAEVEMPSLSDFEIVGREIEQMTEFVSQRIRKDR